MKSKFVRRPPLRPSVVRVAIIPEPYARISFKFHLWLLLDYSHRKKNVVFFYENVSLSLTWDPMGAKISKRYSSYKS